MLSTLRKLAHLGILLITAVLVLSACSEDKGPPDDEGDLSAQCQSIPRFKESYSICAEQALAGSGLSKVEQNALASCNADIAQPETSSEDLFEVARAVVRSSCL
jgi:hypothetical protein